MGITPWPQGTLGLYLSSLIAQNLFAAFVNNSKSELAKGVLETVSPIFYYVMGPSDAVVGNYWTNATSFPTPRIFLRPHLV